MTGRLGTISRFRVPLHFKVMVSYLVVVGLVLLPTLIYLRTVVRKSLIEVSERRLQVDLDALASRLARSSDADLPSMVGVIVGAMPQRVTITDAYGHVLGDSLGERVFASHASRPEIAAALASGFGQAVRTSSTTGDERIYVARRFPAEGPARGVVRLSVPTQDLDDALVATYRFTEKAGAMGLTAAVVLSLVAALVVSRPLRRLTEAVRAYGQGDLGHPVGVDSTDELGELADALRELSVRLADRLREAGAHKAAFQALIEELPLGILVYGEDHQPLTVSSRARELCHLPLAEDIGRTGDWIELPEHASAIAQARAEDRAVAVPLVLPGRVKRSAELEVRWVVIPGSPANGRIVGIVSDREASQRIDALEELLRDDARLLRKAAASAGSIDAALAARLEGAADQAERAVLPRRATADQLETRDVGSLCAGALEEVKARAAARGVTVNVELDDPALMVVEAEGRTQQAVRRLLDAMIAEAQPNAEVRVESESGPKQVRITARTAEGRRVKTKPIAEIIHCLGGDAGSKHTGEATEAWVKIPRG